MSKKKLKKAYKKALKSALKNQGAAPVAAGAQANGLLGNWGASLTSSRTQQFVLGALLGAAATYVLSNEELRGKMMKSLVKFYAGMSSGFEEMKEQIADIQAEMQAGAHGQE